MIDSHCHLADAVFAPDLDTVVDRAKAAGLERVLVILEAGNEQEALQARRVEAIWPEVRASIGVHPHAAHGFADDPDRAARIVRDQIARTAGARAVGEIGLDYHYDYSPRDVQQHVFRGQLMLARELDLPVVIHTRDAEADTVSMLKDANGGPGAGRLRGVLHCFTGTRELAEAGLAFGFYVSLSGIVTFPRASELRDTAAHIPLDRLLVETDSPFLAPVPHRGTRNEPAHVGAVVAALAPLYGVKADELARRTTANFHTLFGP